MSETAIVPTETQVLAQTQAGPMNPAEVVRQVKLVQEVMGLVMRDGEHYGKIPGCGSKPALLQPGAQVLAFTFRLAPSFDIETKELPNLHREYVARCNLVSIATGQLVGTGIGSCSTMESKYRYRNVADFEVTDLPIPDDAREKKAEYRRNGYGMKKIDDVWAWVKYGDSAKTENPDIADTYNTVLKMASKRAFVHAILNATAASDMFTQDIEDLAPATHDVLPEAEPKADTGILGKIREVRTALDVDDETYLRQLAWAQGSRIEVDTDLTRSAAAKLLAALEDTQAKREEVPS